MNALLRALLLRNRLCMAPAGEGGGGGGAVEGGDTAVIEDPDPNAVDPNADPEAGAAGAGGEDEGGEIVITLGDDPEPDEDADEEALAETLADPHANAAWAKMRVAKKALKLKVQASEQRQRELEQQIQALKPAEPVIEAGPKPQAKDYDMFDDAQVAKYEADRDAWDLKNAQALELKRKRDDAKKEQNAQWESRISAVDKATQTLGADVDEALASFDATFSMVQKGIIVGALDKPETSALMRVALGRNPTKARELAAIADPVKFAVAIGKLETSMKVTKTAKGAPPPDKRLQSGARGAPATGDVRARLLDEAVRTGNVTKLNQYDRDQKAKKRA